MHLYLSNLFGEVIVMNNLTRSVLEDLIKMEISLHKITANNEQKIGCILTQIDPEPTSIILKVTGLNEGYEVFVMDLLEATYKEEITIVEAIEMLELECQLT